LKYCDTCHSAYPDDFTTCPRDQAPLRASSELMPGMRLRGKYEVLEKIGSGGMASVYRARHLTFDEVRAIKLVSSKLLGNDEFERRFRTEAVITRKLQHPNAVRVDDFDTSEDGRPFIVMEYVEGDSLRQVLRREGTLPLQRALAITRQVASALAAAHALGIVHRDIKPDNILLTHGPDGGDFVKVLDFGIAKVREGVLLEGEGYTPTQTGMVIGTPQYISPEQAIGKRGDEVDGRSDLYSLGVVLYEMVTGRLPFASTDTAMGMILHHLQTPPTPPDLARPDLQLPPALTELLMKTLCKERDQRFANASELLTALEAVAAAGPATPRPALTVVVDTEAETGLFPAGGRRETPQPAVTSKAGAPQPPAAPAPATLVAPTLATRSPPARATSVAAIAPRPRYGIWLGAGLAILLLGFGAALVAVVARQATNGSEAGRGPLVAPSAPVESAPPADEATDLRAATDEALLELIEERLANAATTREESIAVEVDQGSVVLSGEVASRAASQTAQALAESVPGVKHVRNRLLVASAQPDAPEGPAHPLPPLPPQRLHGQTPPVPEPDQRAVKALVQQGKDALARDQPATALKAFEAAQVRDPGNAEAIDGMTRAGIQLALQIVSRKVGQSESPAPDAEQARLVRELLEGAREALASGDADVAMKAYRAVLRLDPANSEAREGLVKVAAQIGRDARRPAAHPSVAASARP